MREESLTEAWKATYSDLDVGRLLETTRTQRSVEVVVPVYNGGPPVRRCLESVARNTPKNVPVTVIDDASTDPQIVALLDEIEKYGGAQIIRHEENHGYTRTANEALHLNADSDVVLLNSDTEVGPGWLNRLMWVAAATPNVATVSAMSDNAGAMSVPDPNVANAWPEHLSWDEISSAATTADLPWMLDSPTGHGFCMLVTRAAIEKLSGFDEAQFPRGYGEENDFSLRARSAGMVNLIAPHVFVRHVRSQSFGEERAELIAEGRRKIDLSHPTYTKDIRGWLRTPGLQRARDEYRIVRDRLASVDHMLPRRMYVLHQAGGGTPATNLDLMTALAGSQESFLVESAGLRRLLLHRVTAAGPELLETWEADEPFRVTDGWRQDYAQVIAGWVIRLGISAVHVRHLINHPLTTLPQVLERLRIPMVLSTHDFYYVCPTVHLLDETDSFCGGTCTPGSGRCRLPTRFVSTVPDLKHNWVHEWQRRAAGVLNTASAVIATTPDAANIMAATYPDFANKITIIEHGRDIDRGWPLLRPPGTSRRPGPLRIVAIANWAPQKGTEYLRAIAAELVDFVEFHVFGKHSDVLGEVAHAHGEYLREELPGLLARIDPDLVALVSIWPETYSHTLTESWALGVPVLATDIGAVAERIRTHGGGVLVPVSAPMQAARRVRQIANDPEGLARLRASVPREAVRSRPAMAEDYRALYQGLSGDPRTPRVGYMVEGALGTHPTAEAERLSRWMSSLSLAGRAVVKQVHPAELARGGLSGLDTVVVQSAAAGADVPALFRAADLAGAAVVVDADGMTPGDGVAQLMASADRILVPNHVAAGVFAAEFGREAVVFQSGMDPRVWLRHVDTAPPPNGDEVRVLYLAGAFPGEVHLLNDILPSVERRVGRRVVIETIGGVLEPAEHNWMRTLRVPGRLRTHSEVARWLRTHRLRWSAAVAPMAPETAKVVASDRRLLEYALLNLPAVMSPVHSDADAGQLAIPAGSTSDWADQLAATIADPHTGSRHAERARQWVLTHRMQDRGYADRWLEQVLR